MKTIAAITLLISVVGCSQVAMIDALSEVNREVDICRSELLNALDLTPDNEAKIAKLEEVYEKARAERAALFKEYLERADKLKEDTWDAWKTAAMWAERVGMLAVLLPML